MKLQDTKGANKRTLGKKRIKQCAIYMILILQRRTKPNQFCRIMFWNQERTNNCSVHSNGKSNRQRNNIITCNAQVKLIEMTTLRMKRRKNQRTPTLDRKFTIGFRIFCIWYVNRDNSDKVKTLKLFPFNFCCGCVCVICLLTLFDPFEIKTIHLPLSLAFKCPHVCVFFSFIVTPIFHLGIFFLNNHFASSELSFSLLGRRIAVAAATAVAAHSTLS